MHLDGVIEAGEVMQTHGMQVDPVAAAHPRRSDGVDEYLAG